MPIAEDLLDPESRFSQRLGQLMQAAKAKLTIHSHDLSGRLEDIIAFQADSAVLFTEDFQPLFYRTKGRVVYSVCGVAVPLLPCPGIRIAALKSQMTARS